MDNSFHKVTIISTGSELTMGSTVDTNSSWLAAQLSMIGLEVASIHVFPDHKSQILNFLESKLESANNELFIMTGGLGPTNDDLTIDIIAELANKPIIQDKYALNKINKLIIIKNITTNSELIKRQSRTIQTATVFKNQIGLAPGLMLNIHGNQLIALPGVPLEMKTMFSKRVIPKISNQQTHSKTNFYYIYYLSETVFQTRFLDPANPDEIKDAISKIIWGITSQDGKIKISLTSKDPEILELLHHYLLANFKNILFEHDAIESLHKLAIDRQLKIGIAESCTGGLIGKLLTDTGGSSAWFMGSLVCYSNAAKTEVLGVSAETIQNHGAVSSECALEMAKGALKKLHCDYALSTTGISGPTGGTTEKPVGTVFVGLASKSGAIESHKLYIPLDRHKNRSHSAHSAIYKLLSFMESSNPSQPK